MIITYLWDVNSRHKSNPVEMEDVNDSEVKNNKLVTSVSSNSSFRDLIPFLGWVGCERVKQWKA